MTDTQKPKQNQSESKELLLPCQGETHPLPNGSRPPSRILTISMQSPRHGRGMWRNLYERETWHVASSVNPNCFRDLHVSRSRIIRRGAVGTRVLLLRIYKTLSLILCQPILVRERTNRCYCHSCQTAYNEAVSTCHFILLRHSVSHFDTLNWDANIVRIIIIW
jgi:hypothetical protein